MSRMSDSWKLKRLREIAILNPPKPRGIDRRLPVTFIGMAGITNNGKIIETSIREFQDIEKGYRVFQEGDILLAKITPCFENGKCALTRGLKNGLGIGSTEFHILRVKNGLDPRYLLYHIQSPAFRIRGEARMTGSSGQKRIPASFINSYQIPIPPLSHQRTIIDIISTWDQALELMEGSIERKRLLAATVVEQIIARGNSNWRSAPLVNLAAIAMGHAPPSKHYNRKQLGLPLIQGKGDFDGNHAKPNIWTNHITQTCAAGDILLTVRAPVGAVARSSVSACIGRGICAITPHEIDGDFLFHMLRHMRPRWAKYIQGSTFASISGKDVKRMVISFPESQAEQVAVARALSDIEDEISLMEQQKIHLDKQREALLGKLLYPRLIPHGPGEKS